MPDAVRLAQIKQNISAIMQAAGQTATWRYYVSASANSGEYGLGSAHIYAQRLITGVFASLKPQEIAAAGGYYFAGDLRVTTFETISAQDEILWDGGRYRCISEPISVSLWGVPANEMVIRRA